jgi:hypothetical protein
VSKKRQDKQLQFRTGSQLGDAVAEWANKKNLHINEACKQLVAMSVYELPSWLYSSLVDYADTLTGRNVFTRTCNIVAVAADGASLHRGSPWKSRDEREKFIVDFINSRLDATMKSQLHSKE